MTHKHKHNHSGPEHQNPEESCEQNEVTENNNTESVETVEDESKPVEVDTESVESVENKPTLSEVDILKKEVDELKEKLIYLQADYQNYRKRVAKDISDTRLYAMASTLSPFLTVFDYLNMANVASEKSDNIESIRQGLNMIIAEFNKAFDELNVKKLDSVGKKFNPELHEAVAHEASDTVPEGQILKEWSGGFKMGDKLLRAARVVVSAGPAVESENSEAKKEE